MTNSNKIILSAVLAFIAAVILALQTLGGVISHELSGSGGNAGVSAGGSGSISSGGSGGAGSGGVAASGTGGSGGMSGRGGAGGVVSSGKMQTCSQSWFLEPTWGFGSPFVANVNFATATGNIWNSAFLADLQAYGSVLRLMDWNATNYSKITTWSQRRLPTDAGNADIYTDGSTGIVPGLAYEWQFDLCNRVAKTCWIALPIQADDNYFSQFAALAKQKLNPDVRLIVELSNEVDGGWFGQSNYAYAQGAALELPGAPKYYQGAAWQTYRTLQMKKLVKDARTLVARCVVGNTDLGRQSFATVFKSAQWNPTNETIDVLCMSAYFGNDKDGTSYTFAQAKADIDNLVNAGDGFKATQAIQKQYGIPFFAVYEGGQSVLTNAKAWSDKPEAGQAEAYLLDAEAPYFDFACHYTDASSCNNNAGSSCWGLKTQIGGPETSKSSAYKQWVQNHK